MKRILLGLVLTMSVFFLTGCFELTDKSQLKRLVTSTPLKDFSHLRLVNASNISPSELKEQAKCPTLVRLSSNNEYQLYNCNGKPDSKLKFYSVPDYPNLYIVKLLDKDCDIKDECNLITVKIQDDLAFAYIFLITEPSDFDAFLYLLKSGLKNEQQLARLESLNKPKGGHIKVDTIEEMFFIANLISNDPPKSAMVSTLAIE